ncbi:hypothetical protein L596_012040 [Steinernema carpocapsae]|uniref:Uncharacterized protein n=1 Tax=Steinernema carpocapsae TaxID=34508 RepID=A0A4U5NVT5_STECR|nr:hypothetical protein L596_012040 [Steinernema carpocapsae]
MRFTILPILFYTILISAIVFVIYEFDTSVDEDAPLLFSQISFANLPEIPNPADLNLDLKKLFRFFPPAKFLVRTGIEIHSDTFCVWYNYEAAENVKIPLASEIPVALTTFSTVNYLDVMYKQFRSWNNIVSYAVFFDSQSNQSPAVISWIHNCMPDFKKWVRLQY